MLVSALTRLTGLVGITVRARLFTGGLFWRRLAWAFAALVACGRCLQRAWVACFGEDWLGLQRLHPSPAATDLQLSGRGIILRESGE